MRTLDYLLRRSYDGPVDPRCKEWVLEYLAENDSVINKPLFFIKNLTKVASHILDSDPESLDGLLEKLYDFNMQGIEKIQSGYLEGYTEENLRIMESHFCSHKGNVARKKFRITQDINWAIKWYESELSAAEISEDVDPEHSAYSRSFVAKAARAISNKAKNKRERIVWTKRWYENDLLSARLCAGFDPRHSAHTYAFAGDAAYTLYKITGKEEWGEIAIELYKRCLNYAKSNPDPKINQMIRNVKKSSYKLQDELWFKEEDRSVLAFLKRKGKHRIIFSEFSYNPEEISQPQHLLMDA